MITAELVGGARDGEHVTVAAPYAPVPEALYFPVVVTPGLEDWEPPAVITSLTYRLRVPSKCCATWCVWPRPCACCPRCVDKRVVYDLVRP